MVDSCWDYGPGEVDTGAFKLEPNSVGITDQQIQYSRDVTLHKKSDTLGQTQDFKGNLSPGGSSTGQSGTCIQEQSPVHDSSPCSALSVSAAPICRQFWTAGVYNEDSIPKSKTQAGSGYLHIHPKFLHSNATSHKWAFGAVAELLDNAVDEIQNGATYVTIDKTTNPRDGSPALLIQDDGAGMDPEAMRRCLSFGFSDKKSNSAIGKYGNGFKTSSMRLGADAIVFSRRLKDEYGLKTWTQSIGLLSYTFLTQAGYDRIVVPMVHYEFNRFTGIFESMQSESKEQSNSNLSVLLQWSPYSTEEELLKQFDVTHGTKIIIYNLWLDDEGNMELDFNSDPEDISIRLDAKSKAKDESLRAISENHIANRLHHSLRAYLSILYLRLPETFCIVLRGQVVLYYNIAMDLKYPEFILYKPNSGGSSEGSVVTTIGFLEEAPNVKVHGFNIYHKGRLILPFLPALTTANSKGRGVAGVLEANFIEPTHNKQDFEKTSIFQKLVTRLKEMTIEYWDYHCGLIGYHIPKKARAPLASPASSSFPQPVPLVNNTAVGASKRAPVITNNTAVGTSTRAPVITTVSSRAALNANSAIIEPVVLVPRVPGGSRGGANLKRKTPDHPPGFQSEANMNKTRIIPDAESNMADDTACNQRKIVLLQENEKLHAQCLEFEKAEEELNLKAVQLKTELGKAQKEYAALLSELRGLEKVKVEANAHNIYVDALNKSRLF